MNDAALPSHSSGTHGDRYALVAGIFSAGGGWIIRDGAVEPGRPGQYLSGPDGLEWRTASKEQAREVVALANEADRNGDAFTLPAPLTPLAYAQKHAAEVAADTGAVTPSGREVLRGYSIRYNIVSEVDGQGEDCGYCNWLGTPRPITHQVYATSWDDKTPTTWSTCDHCVLRSIDEVEDVDHEKTITVEKVQ